MIKLIPGIDFIKLFQSVFRAILANFMKIKI